MANRFYSDVPLEPGEHVLRGPEIHHIFTVRRFQVGDQLQLIHGDGCEHTAEILAISKSSLTIRVLASEWVDRELPIRLMVACAMPKGDRGDWLVEKLTELGVHALVPLQTARTIVTPKANRLDNLQRTVIEASKQCGRTRFLAVQELTAWPTVVTEATGLRLVLHTTPTPTDWPAIRAACRTSARDTVDRVWVAIGPEGGFTQEEVQLATEAGWSVASLGPRVLRVETAAVAVAAVLGMGE